MRNFLGKCQSVMGKFTVVAILPLAGCSTIETTAFSPIVLPGGCTIGDNYPACKSLNSTCSEPITIESSYDDYHYSYAQSAEEAKLSNCKTLFANCMDELALSGFIGHGSGQCSPQLIETQSAGNSSKKIFGNIWYLNCANDKTSAIGAFAVATSGMENASAFTTENGTSFVSAQTISEDNNTITVHHAAADASGLNRACTANLQRTTESLGLSQFCVSDFGDNAQNYQSYLGAGSQSTVDYNNLPETPTCAPMPPETTPSDTVTTTAEPPINDTTPFTGITVGIGYTTSTIHANNATETDDNVTVSVGYTAPLFTTTIAGTTVTPTIGVNTSVTMGDQNFVPADTGSTTTSQYNSNTHSFDTIIVPGTAATTQITNVVAVTAQPGVVLQDRVQLHANVGILLADKETSAGGATTQTTGSRVGGGLGVAVTDSVSLNVQGNIDHVGGARTNSVGIGINLAL